MPNPKRDRWYSMDGQSRSRYQASESSRGTRKIVSLVILLGLVVILIQQTSDTKKVEQVATAIGLLPDPKAPKQSDNPTQIASNDTQSNPGLSSPKKTMQDDRELVYEKIALRTNNLTVKAYAEIWKVVLKLATPATLQKIARASFADQAPTETASTGSIDGVQEWIAEVQTQLDKWLQIDSENSATNNASDRFLDPILLRFTSLFQKWSEKWAAPAFEEKVPEVEDWSFFQRGFQLALDRALLEMIEDNSPWRSNERLPFLRSWQRTSVLRDALASGMTGPSQIPKVEVSQLMSVAASLRSSPIRFYGTIARLDKPDSIREPGFEAIEYEIFWLRPDDMSQQPVKVYAPRNNIDQSIELVENKQVMICGFFFKRFAYASQQGPEVAPMLMAAYVGSTTASVRESTTELLQFDTTFSRLEPSWTPPVDLSKPYGIAKERLATSMSGLFMDNVDLESLSNRVDLELIRPLLAVNTLSPEIHLLAESRKNWPVAKRGSIARIDGVVTRIEPISLPPEFSSLLDREVAYRCFVNSFLADGRLQKVIALCGSIPNAWIAKSNASKDELVQPCSINGLLLSDETGAPLMMWASHPQWVVPADLPQEGIPAFSSLVPTVTPAHWFLMQKQWDLSWIDTIQNMQTEPVKPLSQAEHEPFFKLIRLAQRHPYAGAQVDELKSDTQSITDILEKLRPATKSKEPKGKSDTFQQRSALERVSMEGRIVRVTIVPVQEPEQAKLLGADHYYQLDVMADVGNRSYEIKTEKNPILYHKEYPVTCVMAELPDWLIETNSNEAKLASPQTWYPRRKAVLDGWFYRFWKYKTLEMSQALGDRGRQIGPLVVLDSLESVASQPLPSSAMQVGSNTVSILIGLCGIAAIWWFVRKRFANR